MMWRMEARNIIKCLRRNEISNLRLYAFTAITGIADEIPIPTGSALHHFVKYRLGVEGIEPLAKWM